MMLVVVFVVLVWLCLHVLICVHVCVWLVVMMVMVMVMMMMMVMVMVMVMGAGWLQEGKTSLHEAGMWRTQTHTEMAALLIDMGARVNALDHVSEKSFLCLLFFSPLTRTLP
jgi:hypothetical protein